MNTRIYGIGAYEPPRERTPLRYLLAGVAVAHVLCLIILIVKSEYGTERYKTMIYISAAIALAAVLCGRSYMSYRKMRFTLACVGLNTIGTMFACMISDYSVTKMIVIYSIALAAAVITAVSYGWFQWEMDCIAVRGQKRALFICSALLYVVLIVYALLWGEGLGGTVSDIRIMGLSLQLTELQKPLLVLYAALTLSEENKTEFQQVVDVLKYLLMNTVLMVVIGETGTLVVMVLTAILMIALAHRSLGWVTSLSLFFVVVVLVFAIVGENSYELYISGEECSAVTEKLAVLYERISGRVELWSNAESVDELGAGYQWKMAREAMLLGGLFGSNQSVYVPNEDNDYIFTMVLLKLGVIGGLLVIFLFGLLLVDGLRIAADLNRKKERLMSFGFVLSVALQSFIMLAGSTGFIPVSGVPVSFLSEGGACMVVTFATMAFVLNAERYDKKDTLPALVPPDMNYTGGLAIWNPERD